MEKNMRQFQKVNNSMFGNYNDNKDISKRKAIESVPSFVSNFPPTVNEQGIIFENQFSENLVITFNDLSRKVLLLGDSGEGKTNALYQLVDKVINVPNSSNINIIFDSKGDFKKRFADSSEKTIIIESFRSQNSDSSVWNLFEELEVEKNNIKQAARELAKMLAGTRLKDNGRQKFFVEASVEMISTAILVLMQDYYSKGVHPTNKTLVQFLRMTPEAILKRAKEYGLDSMIDTYITPKVNGAYNGQTLGVVAEVNNIISDLFVGQFGETGKFSIRKTIRNNEPVNIFIEYDVSYGATLSPVYTTLISLAVKEVMGRHSGSKVNLFIDEFGLLDYIPDMESAVSFGREQGLFIAAGFQHIGQLRNKYGKDCADGILNNFRNLIAFKTTDYETREFIKNRFGVVNKHLVQYSSLSDKISTNVRETALSDEDILSLKTGEAIISTANGNKPFRFKFQQVKE